MVYDNLNILRKHFFCCTPINTINSLIQKQDIDSFTKFESQEQILNNMVNSDLIKKYPIKRSYQKAFIKWLMNKIKENDEEVHDTIYTMYCNLLSLPSDESIHYRHFILENERTDCISIQESAKIISEGTTGLHSWQGAIELTNWCIENKEHFTKKVILELGCGVGLAGLCIIKNCLPSLYIFTDCHESVIAMLSKNVKLNLLQNEKQIQSESNSDRLKLELRYNSTEVRIMELKWEDIDKYVNEDWVVPDVIIGADILYDTESFESLIVGLKTFLAFNNVYAVIAATVRNAGTVSEFLHLLEVHDLDFEECSVSRRIVCTGTQDLPIRILKIFRKKL